MPVGKFVMSDTQWPRLCTTPLAGARTVRAFSQTTLSALSRASRATAAARCTYITSIRSQKGAPLSPLRTGVSSSALRTTAGFTAGYGASSRSGSGVLTTTRIRRVGWSASGDSIASPPDLHVAFTWKVRTLQRARAGHGVQRDAATRQVQSIRGIWPPSWPRLRTQWMALLVETPRPCKFCGTYNTGR